MANVYEFAPAIVDKWVRKFVIAYRADGKAAAGLVLANTPKLYKTEIVKRIQKELNL